MYTNNDIWPKLKLILFALYRKPENIPPTKIILFEKKKYCFFIGHDRSSYFFL